MILKRIQWQLSLFCFLLLITTGLSAQTSTTCDSGPQDAIVQARQAYLDADIARYSELMTEALELCRDNPERLNIAQTSLKLFDNMQAQFATMFTPEAVAASLDEFQEILETARSIDADWIEADALTFVGIAYAADRQDALALDALNDALTLWIEMGSEKGARAVLETIDLLLSASDGAIRKALDANLRGVEFFNQGQYSKALEQFEEALATAQDLDARAMIASIYVNMGNVYYELGSYGAALQNLNVALELFTEMGLREGEGRTRNAIGIVYTALGQIPEARSFLDEALIIRRETGNELGEAITLNALGVIYDLREEYETALEYYTQALEIRRRLNDINGVGIVLNNIATANYALDRYAEAIAAYEEALTLMGQDDTLMAGYITGHLAVLYTSLGDYSRAEMAYGQAISLLESLGARDGMIYARMNRGHMYEQSGQIDLAIADYTAVILDIESVLTTSGLESARISLLGQAQNSYPYARLAALKAGQGLLAEALDYAERGRAILSRSAILSAPVAFKGLSDADLLVEEAELREAVVSAQNQSDALAQDITADPEMAQRANADLNKARTEYQQFLEQAQLSDPTALQSLAFETADLSKIQSALPEDTTLLEYVVTGDEVLVFVITQQEISSVVLPAPAQDIAQQVNAWLVDRHQTAPLGQLYTQLIAPLTSQIRTSRLLISADRKLNYVPFAALQVSDDHYLIDDYAISMIPSATSLVLLKDRPVTQPAKPALVLAQPEAPNLPRLNNAQTEAVDVATVLLVEANTDASETDLRADVAGSGVLHISAHAALDPFAMLYSTIYLAADEANDGRFEVREIYELDLSATELVILSGCETGSGGTGEDFGVMNRAFFGVGAQKVVSSLWKVDEESTGLLLTNFAQERKNMDNDADALRAAMQTIRDEYPEYAEPYYWASFVLTGLP